MHMSERQWGDAATDFFEAFKNYDEASPWRPCRLFRPFTSVGMRVCVPPPSNTHSRFSSHPVCQAGVPRRIQCLKYLVLAYMLMQVRVSSRLRLRSLAGSASFASHRSFSPCFALSPSCAA